MPKPEKIQSFEATLLRASAKALLVEIHGEEIWLPLSQIIDAEDHFNSDSTLRTGDAKIRLTEWIAKEKGLI